MDDCLQEELLERYRDRAASADEARRARAHLERCADCAAKLAEARADQALVPELRRALAGDRGDPADLDAEPAEPALERYRVLGRMGAGGMGVVYEAEQRSPRRRVALKVLRPGRAGPRALARFEFEAELLGRLDHPGIARIHEAGTYRADGLDRPFFAMEKVEGRPLDRWVSQERPPLARRLGLFVELCRAVQHAHQKGVIHRDLKPDNVLVTREGRPKVLDFGVARAVGDEARRATLRTEAGQVVGTLAYMSPEQVRGDEAQLDTRADVYALGVLLYELCAGRRPIEPGGRSLAEELARVEREDPPLLGTLSRECRGDLETIAAKALAKERERRYAGAQELADDVARHLRHEPIAARPPSATYHLRRFARRHRALVSAGALIVLAVMAGLVATLSQAERARAAETAARAQRDDAVLAAQRAAAVSGFVEELFRAGDPVRSALRGDYTVREALDEAARRLEHDPPADAAVAADLHHLIGSAYVGLELHGPAARHLERMLALEMERRGADSAAAAAARLALASQRAGAGRLEEAEQLLRAALAVEGEHEPAVESNARRAATLASLSLVLAQRGAGAEAERAAREALELGAAAGEAGLAARAQAHAALARILAGRARPAEARTELERAHALQTQLHGAGSAHALGHALNRARNALQAGERDEAGAILDEVARHVDARLDRAHPLRAWYLSVAADLSAARGEPRRAEEQLREALALVRARLGQHPETARALRQLGEHRLRAGAFAEAAGLLEEAVEMQRRTLGDGHPELASSLSWRGLALLRTGAPSAAAESCDEAIAIVRAAPAAAVHAHFALSVLASVLDAEGDRAGAEAVLREALDAGREQYGETALQLSPDLFRLARFVEAKGQREEAAELYRAVLAATEDLPAPPPERALAERALERLRDG